MLGNVRECKGMLGNVGECLGIDYAWQCIVILLLCEVKGGI